MKTIIIGFSVPKKKTLFAKAIMWVDKIPYDHVYIKWNWASVERDIIYQASKLTVHFESNVTFDQHAQIIEEYEVQISDECHKTIMQFCMDNSGKPYSLKMILGFLCVKICNCFGKKINNPFPANGAEFVCSTIGAEILSRAGIKIDQDFDNIDPKDLRDIVVKAGLKRIS